MPAYTKVPPRNSRSGSRAAAGSSRGTREDEAIAGEAAVRQLAGLPGNPAANLQGLRMQPRLGRISRASNPINPVDPYYRQQLIAETERVLSGQELPEQALQMAQQRVLAQEQRLKLRYGPWNWYLGCVHYYV